MKTLAISGRIFKEIFRDKKTLAMIFIVPLIVMALMSYVFKTYNNTDVNIGTIGVSQQVESNLAKVKNINIEEYSSKSSADKALHDEKIDSFIVYKNDKYTMVHANTDPSKTSMTKAALSSALTQGTIHNLSTAVAKMSPVKQSQPKMHIANQYKYGSSKSSFFDKMMPTLLAFFVFLLVFLTSGMALLKERTSGTLGRLLATPVKRSEVIFGYTLSYGIMAIFQTILIVLFTINVLDIEVTGSIWLILLTTFLLSIVAIAAGLLLSTFAKSEFQLMQFIPLVAIPQIFFSGLIPLDSLATWAQDLSYIIPIKYASEAISNVMMRGFTFSGISIDLMVIVLFIIVLTTINIWGLKRYRKV
ncbi:ABC transporter permease [Apilactobacillus bombintestini]|uniref:ABC transporter permease n=1 Tax=Apilactobacillus bombintestini TaxID=2419772 RepID=A0A387AWL6_9LACO|nr:ABC transporter permease [Apilactobacillus bombintestini]AYF93056.1 ABC transporter permease [Apilactobacillus bombintestini]